MPAFGGGGEPCDACGKTVYIAERVLANKCRFHKDCLKCGTCGKKLSGCDWSIIDSKPFCKPHLLQKLKREPAVAGMVDAAPARAPVAAAPVPAAIGWTNGPAPWARPELSPGARHPDTNARLLSAAAQEALRDLKLARPPAMPGGAGDVLSTQSGSQLGCTAAKPEAREVSTAAATQREAARMALLELTGPKYSSIPVRP